MSEFAVHRKDLDDISILNIEGYLDAHTAPQFEESLRKLLEEKRYKIIVNFKNLQYISSAGLGVFMGFIEDIRANKGDIKMSNMSDKVFRIFDLLGFPALYDILPDEKDALEKFRSASGKE